VHLQSLGSFAGSCGGVVSSVNWFFLQAEKAGEISQCQLALAGRMGDDLLASRCKLYAAYSLLQRNKLRQAARIVR